MIKLRSGILLFLIFSLAAIAVPHAVAGDAGARQPVAEVLGRTVYAEELVQPAMVDAQKGSPPPDTDALERMR